MKFEGSFSRPKTPADDSVDMGRRNFLKKAAVLTGAGLVGELAVVNEARKIYDGKEFVDYRRDFTELTDRTELLEKVLELRLKIQTVYGINIELTEDEIEKSDLATRYGFEELRISKQLEALEALDEALAEYPPFMIAQSGLKNVIVTTRPKIGSEHEGRMGYVSPGHLEAPKREWQPEMAVAYDWNAGHDTPSSFKSIDTDTPDASTLEQREADSEFLKKYRFKGFFHHELTHFLVDVPGTEESPRHEETEFVDDWKEKFGSYHNRMKLAHAEEARVKKEDGSEAFNYAGIISPPYGFASGYGLTSLEEDRATIMRSLMLDKHFGTDETGPGPNILEEKVALMKNFYLKQSCGLMDAAYWRIEDSDEARVFNDIKKLNDHYFKERANYIIKTPYENQSAILKDEVSTETYKIWQQKLAKIYPNQVGDTFTTK